MNKTANISFPDSKPPVDATPARVDWISIANQLYSNPGRWARLEEPQTISTARTKASQIKGNDAPGYEDGTWDARVERIEDTARGYMWIMCVSPESPGQGTDGIAFT